MIKYRIMEIAGCFIPQELDFPDYPNFGEQPAWRDISDPGIRREGYFNTLEGARMFLDKKLAPPPIPKYHDYP